MTLCAKCKKNPAVFFITKMENGKTTSEGLCLSCAKELGIAPINQMIDNFGVSDEELENINNQMSEFMESMEGMPGMDGDLSEMLGQIEAAQRDLNIRISNIVLMGMGEPLDNFDNVVKFLRLVSSDNGLNIGMRHITLSTCGIVPKIYELAKLHLGITLSVSLHAPNDEIRQRTMPIARKYSIEELLKACSDYFKTTGRRVTFEYSMISGVNDSDENARELAKRLEGTQSHVNLIPVNTVEGTGYLKSNIKRQQAFINILAAKNIGATVRRTLGSDINASCGQLKRKHIEEGGK